MQHILHFLIGKLMHHYIMFNTQELERQITNNCITWFGFVSGYTISVSVCKTQVNI